MYFCPNCSYSFDIVKSSNSITKDVRTEITKMSEGLKLYEENKDMTKYVATFSRDDTSKNKRYQKFNKIYYF